MFAKLQKTEIPKFKLNSIKFNKSICGPNNILSSMARNSENKGVFFIISTHFSRRNWGKCSQITELSKLNLIFEYEATCKIISSFRA